MLASQGMGFCMEIVIYAHKFMEYGIVQYVVFFFVQTCFDFDIVELAMSDSLKLVFTPCLFVFPLLFPW